ncbi:MAG: c-type cytochrome [Flavobacteriales bacterium]
MKTRKIWKMGAILFAATLIMTGTGCKKWGCTDPKADNYDSKMKKDDGSCVYTNYLDSLDDAAYEAADGIMGGKLYDKFWATETGWTAPAGITATDISDYGDFYRCKQCHGWDRMGSEGWYCDRGPKTGRPDVAINLVPHVTPDEPDEVFWFIKHKGGRAVDPSLTQDGTNGQGNPMPEFGSILTDAEVWDIVKFLKVEAYDVTNLYDLSISGTYPNGVRTVTNIGKDGSASAGDTYYSSNCSGCHGADGLTIAIVDDGDTLTPGYFGRNKPYELQHKVKFGHLGSAMTGFPTCTESDLKDLLVALQDTFKYPDW